MGGVRIGREGRGEERRVEGERKGRGGGEKLGCHHASNNAMQPWQGGILIRWLWGGGGGATRDPPPKKKTQ